ncbi:MAG: toll/interleukin-1 receptor domain-containing protein [Clostridia bacterium]|nr:toll/interleukin-1 receptor domain-containing protein [Clostridia bacterium]
MEKDVFISYKSEEFAEADELRRNFEENGITCWMAPMCIKGGSSYAKEIPAAIRSSKAFVLILSKAAQDSKWVSRELDQAINHDKIVLPFMIENCEISDDFDFYLTNVQRYAAYEDKQSAMDKIIEDTKSYLGISGKASDAKAEEEEITEIVTPEEAPSEEIEAEEPKIEEQEVPDEEGTEEVLVEEPATEELITKKAEEAASEEPGEGLKSRKINLAPDDKRAIIVGAIVAFIFFVWIIVSAI